MHTFTVCLSILVEYSFCIMALHRPAPVQRRCRLDQVGHVSLKHGGRDSLGQKDSLCGVVWRWLDEKVSQYSSVGAQGFNRVEEAVY